MQNRSTSKLKEREPIFGFFTPPSSYAPAFIEPTQRAFDNPPPGRKHFVFGRQFRLRWLIPATAMSDMFDVTSRRDHFVNILRIISFVKTQVLLLRSTHYNNGDDQVRSRPLVMLVGATDEHSQGGAPLIHQQMDFAAGFASVGWVPACAFTAQGRRDTFTVDTLPLPSNAPFAGIKPGHPPHDLGPPTFSFPGLKTFMQDTTGNPKPILVDSFPLTARPHDVPETIDHIAMRDGRSTRPIRPGWFRQFSLDNAPQLAGYSKVVNILRFCVTMFSQGISFQVGFGDTLVSGYALFFNSCLFFG